MVNIYMFLSVIFKLAMPLHSDNWGEKTNRTGIGDIVLVYS